jgi:hypothetical protein
MKVPTTGHTYLPVGHLPLSRQTPTGEPRIQRFEKEMHTLRNDPRHTGR